MNNNISFSQLNRNEFIKSAKSDIFDLLIIGGGITGAGIALDAASRGLKVILIEKQDFSEGTSSRSTKLVHGGLRYLQNYEFKLVREVGREREIVFNNAPHIVRPQKMMLPIIKNGSINKFMGFLGLTIYDFLAGVKKSERKKILSKTKTLNREKLLNPDILKSSILYYEYKTNDSRLTIEVLKKAFEYDANLLNYVKAEDFIYNNGKVTGVNAVDLISSNSFEIKAKYIVNATGPWVDGLRKKDKSLNEHQIKLTKGIHLTISHDRFNLSNAVYFDNTDGRMIFVIPRDESVYIGTTDTFYNDNLENPKVKLDDVNYLLDAVNKMFPSIKLKINDIESSWAGLRPLIHKKGKKPSELSRKDEIFTSESGLISIAGGKLTGYRLMAKKVVDNIFADKAVKEKSDFIKCKTLNLKLAGGEFNFDSHSFKLIELAEEKFYDAQQLKISLADSNKLFYRYGTNYSKIIEKAYELRASNNKDNLWLKAEIWYCINNEMINNLSDFFIRRTGMIFFDYNKIKSLINVSADYMQTELNWSDEFKNKSISDFEKIYNQVKSFD